MMKKLTVGLCALVLFLGNGAEVSAQPRRRRAPAPSRAPKTAVSPEQRTLAGRIDNAVKQVRDMPLPEGITKDDVSPLIKMMEMHRDTLNRRAIPPGQLTDLGFMTDLYELTASQPDKLAYRLSRLPDLTQKQLEHIRLMGMERRTVDDDRRVTSLERQIEKVKLDLKRGTASLMGRLRAAMKRYWKPLAVTGVLAGAGLAAAGGAYYAHRKGYKLPEIPVPGFLRAMTWEKLMALGEEREGDKEGAGIERQEEALRDLRDLQAVSLVHGRMKQDFKKGELPRSVQKKLNEKVEDLKGWEDLQTQYTEWIEGRGVDTPIMQKIENKFFSMVRAAVKPLAAKGITELTVDEIDKITEPKMIERVAKKINGRMHSPGYVSLGEEKEDAIKRVLDKSEDKGTKKVREHYGWWLDVMKKGSKGDFLNLMESDPTITLVILRTFASDRTRFKDQIDDLKDDLKKGDQVNVYKALKDTVPFARDLQMILETDTDKLRKQIRKEEEKEKAPPSGGFFGFLTGKKTSVAEKEESVASERKSRARVMQELLEVRARGEVERTVEQTREGLEEAWKETKGLSGKARQWLTPEKTPEEIEKAETAVEQRFMELMQDLRDIVTTNEGQAYLKDLGVSDKYKDLHDKGYALPYGSKSHAHVMKYYKYDPIPHMDEVVAKYYVTRRGK